MFTLNCLILGSLCVNVSTNTGTRKSEFVNAGELSDSSSLTDGLYNLHIWQPILGALSSAKEEKHSEARKQGQAVVVVVAPPEGRVGSGSNEEGKEVE